MWEAFCIHTSSYTTVQHKWNMERILYRITPAITSQHTMNSLRRQIWVSSHHALKHWRQHSFVESLARGRPCRYGSQRLSQKGCIWRHSSNKTWKGSQRGPGATVIVFFSQARHVSNQTNPSMGEAPGFTSGISISNFSGSAPVQFNAGKFLLRFEGFMEPDDL